MTADKTLHEKIEELLPGFCELHGTSLLGQAKKRVIFDVCFAIIKGTQVIGEQESKLAQALEIASDILLKFQSSHPADRPKIEEWEACYAMLFKQLNNLPKTGGQGWQTIDSAPKDGTEILGWNKHLGRHIVSWGCQHQHNPNYFWISSTCNINHIDQPTHWQPLPPTNKSEECDGE